MACGDGPDDAALSASWNAFCDRLKAAGARAFKDHNPADPLHRADAFRFLTQNLGQAFDLALETRDTRHPALHAFVTPTRKLGGDAADFLYLQAWIDGDTAYRISGNRGTARFLNFTVQGPRPALTAGGFAPLHEPFGDVPEANLFGHQLVSEWDGGFVLHIGGPERGPNWLPTTPGTRKLFIRQGFDRWDETPARMRIEAIGADMPKPLPTPADMIAAFDWAGTFAEGLMTDWPDWPFAHGGVDATRPNTFPPEADTEEDRKRGRAAANMTWELGPDEALIVQFDWHPNFWMLANMGVFFNSMDYRDRPVSYTPARTMVDADGKVRLVLAHRDPGYHNWIDTQGFARGNLTYRSLLGAAPTNFVTTRVGHDAIPAALPPGSARITPAERIAALHARRDAIHRRYSV